MKEPNYNLIFKCEKSGARVYYTFCCAVTSISTFLIFWEEPMESTLLVDNVTQGTITDFSKISTPEQLIEYLSSSKRIGTGKSVYHYTHIGAVLSIIKKGYWIIKSPEGMNDTLEYQSWSAENWKNVFFASFMLEQKESIGMWSMYAQPWEKGVKIAIDGVAFKKWIRGIKEVYMADPDTYEVDPEPVPISESTKIHHTAIAYADFENIDQAGILRYSNKNNAILNHAFGMPILCGYIKNDAWIYEREIRLRVDVDKKLPCKAVAIKLTDDLINAITIVKGPRFEGELILSIQKELDAEKASSIDTDKSLFFGKLKTISCDFCKRKNMLKEFETTRLIIKTEIKIANSKPMLNDESNNQEVDIFNLTEHKIEENGFVCYSRDNSQKVCHIGLSEYQNKIEISYGTEDAFRGKGYMSEALPAVISWLFTHTVITKIYARIGDNPISEHILIKNHFKQANEEYHKDGKLYKLAK
jgi:RimJ/RimL family protein N-acetyltransferase